MAKFVEALLFKLRGETLPLLGDTPGRALIPLLLILLPVIPPFVAADGTLDGYLSRVGRLRPPPIPDFF